MSWLTTKNRIRYNKPEDGNPPAPNPTPPADNTPAKENIIDPFTDFWQDKPDESDPQKQPAPPQQTTQPAPQQTDPFGEHVKGLSFVSQDTITAAMEAASQGDTKALVDVMNQVGRESYKQSLVTAAQLQKSQISKAVADAMKHVRGSVDTDLAVRELQEALPIASDPLFGPNARAIFSRAVTRGHSVKDAIKLTENYFSRLGARVVGDKGINKKVSSRPGSRGFSKEDPLEALFMDAGGDPDVEDNDFDALLSQT